MEFTQATSAPRAARTQASPVRVLSRKLRYRFDESGNWAETYTQRYEILNREGTESWGGTGTQWSPWYMDRPTLSAVVLDPDGTRRSLDPNTVAESAAYPDVPAIYSDGRLLRAPLPGIRIGSIVEETVAKRTKQPFFVGGSAFELAFQSPIPVEAVELALDLPKGLPLNVEVLGAQVERQDSEANGRRLVTFKGGPYAAIDPIEAYAPADVPAWPGVAFSTAESWQQIATAYAEIVKSRLEGASLPAIGRGVTRAGDSPRVKATRLLREVKQRVRYAAVEFGQAAIVPARPQETLERAYGDCKDQSLLLVALLRQAGVPATIALLRTGPGSDVRARVPALDVFDHAIVYVPGDEPLWIDPTSDYARPNELPENDQGRLALIIDPATTGLVQIPVSSSSQNTYMETREFRLPENGRAALRETTVATGIPEQSLRASFTGPKEDVGKNLNEYAKEAHAAQEPVRSTYGDPLDLSQSFRVELEIDRAGVSSSSLLAASVSTTFGVLFSYLPRALFDQELRKLDLVLPRTYRAEVRYVVVPPPHYAAFKLPAARSTTLGPARFSRSYEKKTDGTVQAVYAFDIDRRRLTPREVEALRKGLEAIEKEPNDVLEFEHEGQQLVRARKSVEGVRLFSTLAQQNPNDAYARLRLAVTLVDLGFGGQARKHARAAAAIAPNDALVQRLQATILERDEFGRYQRLGFDRAGAIAAYRRAIEIEPEDTFTRIQLALAYEHDEHGRRYWNAEETGKAADQYGTIPAEELAGYDGGGFKHNQLYALFYARRFDELRRRLDDPKLEEPPKALSVALATIDGGAVAAITQADRLGLRGEDRSRELAAAGETLVRLQRYREAAALFGAASGESDSSAAFANRASLMQRMNPVDVSAVKTDTPDAVARKLLLVVAQSDDYKDRIKELSSARASNKALDGFALGMRRRDVTVDSAVLADVLSAMYSAKTEGDDATGFRVTTTLVAPGSRSTSLNVYVVKEDGGYRFRTIEDAGELGCEALYLYEQRREKAARQWLAWAKERLSAGAGDDALRAPPFLRLWKDGKGDVDLAAAALCVDGSQHESATRMLAGLGGGVRPNSDPRGIEHALVHGYFRQNDGAKALKLAERLLAAHPDSEIARSLVLRSLWILKRWKDYEKIVRAALAKETERKKRATLLDQLAGVHTISGNLKQAREVALQVVSDGEAQSGTYNRLAWNALFADLSKPEDTLSYALQAAQMSGFKSYAELHTLASVYLELGKIEEARQLLPKLLDFDSQPRQGTWLIVGRLAEAYGLKDVASDAYGRIKPEEHPSPVSVSVLARKRLDWIAKGGTK